MADQKPADNAIVCPHCGKPLDFELVSKFSALSRVSFVLSPQPGEFLQARTVGGALENLDKLYAAVAKEMGHMVTTTVTNVTCESGRITFELAIARY
jgi:hypothetical protein